MPERLELNKTHIESHSYSSNNQPGKHWQHLQQRQEILKSNTPATRTMNPSRIQRKIIIINYSLRGDKTR